MAAIALAFLKRNNNVASVLMGARNEHQLLQNVRAYNTKIPDEIVDKAVMLSEKLKEAEGFNADLWVSGGRMR